MSDTTSIEDNIYKAAVHFLQYQKPVIFKPEKRITQTIVDEVSIPLIYREGYPEPLVPAWMAHLKLLWPYRSTQLTQLLHVGLEPTDEELELIEIINRTSLYEYGPPGDFKLKDTRNCTLLPFSSMIQCYQIARSLSWAPGTGPSQANILLRLGPQGHLCPSVQRAGVILLPAGRLVEIASSCRLELEYAIAAGLGVTASSEESAALKNSAYMLGLPWSCAEQESQRLVPVCSYRCLSPNSLIVSLAPDEAVKLMAAPEMPAATGYQTAEFGCLQCAYHYGNMEIP